MKSKDMKRYHMDIQTYPKERKLIHGIDPMCSYPRDNPEISLDEGFFS